MSIGVFQLILILVIVLIVFGSGKLPNVLGDLGKGIKNFKKEIKDEKKESLEKDKKDSEVIEGEVLDKEE